MAAFLLCFCLYRRADAVSPETESSEENETDPEDQEQEARPQDYGEVRPNAYREMPDLEGPEEVIVHGEPQREPRRPHYPLSERGRVLFDELALPSAPSNSPVAGAGYIASTSSLLNSSRTTEGIPSVREERAELEEEVQERVPVVLVARDARGRYIASEAEREIPTHEDD